VWSKTTTREAPETFLPPAFDSGSRRAQLFGVEEVLHLRPVPTNSKPVTSGKFSGERPPVADLPLPHFMFADTRRRMLLGPKVSFTVFHAGVDGVVQARSPRPVSGLRAAVPLIVSLTLAGPL